MYFSLLSASTTNDVTHQGIFTAKKLNFMIEEMCMIGLNFRYISFWLQKIWHNHLLNMCMMDEMIVFRHDTYYLTTQAKQVYSIGGIVLPY